MSIWNTTSLDTDMCILLRLYVRGVCENLNSRRGRHLLHPRRCRPSNAVTGVAAHPVAHIDKRDDGATFDHDAGQSSCSKGTGIDIDPVEPDVRLEHRRVAVDNDLLELLVPKQEVVANPEKVIFRLLLNRNERTQACVDEKKISTDERKLESLEELAVRFGRCAGEVARESGLIIEGRIHRRLQSVRDEGLETTVLPPIIQERGGLQEIEQERLMVPLEENHFRRAAWRDQKIKDLLRIRAAIDVVAKENRDRLGNRMEHDVHLDLQK